MPVVTTLFRNLFDNIFTIFYGCWTVFNGVGPVAHPPITIWSSVQKVDSVLNRTDLDPPWPTSQCPPCVTLGSTVCPGRLCSMYCCVPVYGVHDVLCACVCACVEDAMWLCLMHPLRGLSDILVIFLALTSNDPPFYWLF